MVSSEMFGPYRLVDLLGSGGMGEVWRALDTRKRDRPVALKLLPGHLSARPDVEARFLREARVAATLHEPHVVPIHDYGTVDGRFFIEMRLVEGRDADAVLAEGGPLSAERAVDVVGQVASALDAAHDAGLVHRDVKPSNILLVEAPATGRDFAYLIDFGIAVDLAGTKITSGELRGTWAYTAPERFDGRTDPRTDVYALGCVLHEALTGRSAFAEESQFAYMRAHCVKDAPRPSAVRLGVPRAFDGVVAKAGEGPRPALPAGGLPRRRGPCGARGRRRGRPGLPARGMG